MNERNQWASFKTDLSWSWCQQMCEKNLGWLFVKIFIHNVLFHKEGSNCFFHIKRISTIKFNLSIHPCSSSEPRLWGISPTVTTIPFPQLFCGNAEGFLRQPRASISPRWSALDVPETHYLSSLQDASFINAEPTQLALFIGVHAFPWHTIKLLNFLVVFLCVKPGS